MVRHINTIAAEVSTLWITNGASRNVKNLAKPYLEAMMEIRTVRDTYGLESGDEVVRQFLTSAKNWRGDDARRIKAELKHILER